MKNTKNLKICALMLMLAVTSASTAMAAGNAYEADKQLRREAIEENAASRQVVRRHPLDLAPDGTLERASGVIVSPPNRAEAKGNTTTWDGDAANMNRNAPSLEEQLGRTGSFDANGSNR